MPYVQRGMKSLFSATRRSKAKSMLTRRNRQTLPSSVHRGLGTRNLTVGNRFSTRLVYAYNASLQTSTSASVIGTGNQFKLNDVFDPAVGAESA